MYTKRKNRNFFFKKKEGTFHTISIGFGQDYQKREGRALTSTTRKACLFRIKDNNNNNNNNNNK
jgi:hypothetical protein